MPELIKICELSEVSYAFGFTTNAVLKRKINYLLEKGANPRLRIK